MQSFLSIFDSFYQYPIAAALVLIYLLWVGYTDIKMMKISNKSALVFLILRIVIIFYYPIKLNHFLAGVFGYLIFFIPNLLVEFTPDILAKMSQKGQLQMLPKSVVDGAYETSNAMKADTKYNAAGDMKFGFVLGLWLGFKPFAIVGLTAVFIMIVITLIRRLGRNKAVSFAEYFTISYILYSAIYYICKYAG